MSKKNKKGFDISSLLAKNPHSIFWFFNPSFRELHVVYSLSVDSSKLIHDFAVGLSSGSQIVYGGILKNGFYQCSYIVNFLAQSTILHFCDSINGVYITKEEYVHDDLIKFYDIAIASCDKK